MASGRIELPSWRLDLVKRMVSTDVHVYQVALWLHSDGHTGRALDVLFDHIDGAMLDGDPEPVFDQLCTQVDASKDPLVLLLGVLAATNPWRRALPRRGAMIAILRDRLAAEGRSAQEIESLLSGYAVIARDILQSPGQPKG
jgi:hypothetical protein